MKNTTIVKSIALTTLLCASSAYAATGGLCVDGTNDCSSHQSNGIKSGRFYVDAGLGSAATTVPNGYLDTNDGSTLDPSRTDTSVQLAAGYSKAINNSWELAGEVSYNNFGNATFGTLLSKETFKTSSIDIATVATYHVNNSWSIFGKGGVAHMNSTDSYDSISSSWDTHSKLFKPLIGFGARYHINSNLSFQATYTHYFGDSSFTDSGLELKDHYVPIIDNILVGIHYQF